MSKGRALGVRIRVDLAPGRALGSGKVALLEGIARAGSLSAAAAALGMSYRRAWGLLQDLNAAFDEAVAVATVGGTSGGGAQLTDFGRALIAAYRAVEAKALAEAQARFAPLERRGARRKRGAARAVRPKGPRRIAKRR
ncbi:MAG: winged helix-turn-helix domain-containing protein [Myxococcota bacterium]|jgi:molybdate transport system regulatory protein